MGKVFLIVHRCADEVGFDAYTGSMAGETSTERKENVEIDSNQVSPKHDWGDLGLDWVLQSIIDLTNTTGLELGITLLVDGLQVSGTLVSGKTYFTGLAEEMADAYKSNEGASNAMRTYFGNFSLVYDDISDGEKHDLPMYVHLKNARFFHNSGRPMPSNRGIWWRGRLASVSGFYFGILSAE